MLFCPLCFLISGNDLFVLILVYAYRIVNPHFLLLYRFMKIEKSDAISGTA